MNRETQELYDVVHPWATEFDWTIEFDPPARYGYIIRGAEGDLRHVRPSTFILRPDNADALKVCYQSSGGVWVNRRVVAFEKPRHLWHPDGASRFHYFGDERGRGWRSRLFANIEQAVRQFAVEYGSSSPARSIR